MRGLVSAFQSLLFKRNHDEDNDLPDEASDEIVVPKRGTVLVIDDEISFVDAMRSILKQAGYNVLTATSGSKGLNMLRYAPRDIGAVLLDYQMPGFSGMDTLPYIQKLSPNVKIIGISGVEAKKMPPSFSEGVAHMIRKPFTTSELLETLETVLLPPSNGNGNGKGNGNGSGSAHQAKVEASAAGAA
jgi:DNA-binding NtrC family response regulator